jgi:hypothetical protein
VIDRYFLVLSNGHSGSAWLAKVLNSHFDALCLHEHECVTYTDTWPPRLRPYWDFSWEERLRNLGYLLSSTHRYGETYKAIGCLGMMPPSLERYLTQLATYFPGSYARTRFYFLLRNPISQLHSQTSGILQMAPLGQEGLHKFHFTRALPVISRLEGPAKGVILSLLECADVETQFFVYGCLDYLALLRAVSVQLDRVRYPCVLRLEQLTGNWNDLGEKLREITGLEYELPARATEKVNVKSGARAPAALFQSWPEERRWLFQMLFAGEARILAQLGYDLDDLTRPEASVRPAPTPRVVFESGGVWVPHERSLRAARAELGRTREALAEVWQQYEEAFRRVGSPPGRLGRLARRLEHLPDYCQRALIALRTMVRLPARVPRQPPEDSQSRARAA